MKRLMRILQVSTSDRGGGAEKVAYYMHRTYRAQGYPAWLAVGNKRTDDPDVVRIPDHAGAWQRLWLTIGDFFAPLEGKVRGAARVRQWLRLIGELKKFLETYQGHENLEFPGSWRILDLLPEKPAIIHCHNLHVSYFDLRVLPWLSQQAPLILTLHDAWLLSGHCAHSFDCARWKTGCGECPDLTIYPSIQRDGTAYNWRRKQKIYAKSRLYVTTPSQWLMRKVEQSMLVPAIIEAKVIPNGVDLSIFSPANKQVSRECLGIALDAKVLLFTANGIRQNIWKDYKTMRKAIVSVAERMPANEVLFIALGEDAPAEQIGPAKVLFVPYQKDPKEVARYYQAADVYLHAAKADTFPNTVLEALACGTPVVATAIGGTPEQIDDGATGFLTPYGDAEAMATCIELLLSNDILRQEISAQAAKSAIIRFDFERQVKDYLEWYIEIIN